MEQQTARVTAVFKDRYELLCQENRLYAKLKTAAYAAGEQPYPTTGDFVTILRNPQGDSLIVKTHARTSFFSRLEPGPGKPREQAVAANFEYVFILTSLNQDFNLRRVERYLARAWQSGATPVIVLTKADIAQDVAEKCHAVSAAAPGVAVHAVSAVTGFGLDELRPYLAPGKTVVFLGSSGVGKSSLLNALAGADIMAVNTIREDDAKGRHTTTHRQLITLACGAHIIDTPGMRVLGMWDAHDGVGEVFGDVEALFGGCRFSDCRHKTEPGCAILEALQNGALTPARWESYQKLQREALFARDRAAAMREKQAQHIAIAKFARSRKK